jgi:lipopolysaccharide transport system ATP-binding protein
MTDTLIKLENVSKKFCRGLKRSLWYGLRDLGNELAGREHGGHGELRQGEFWAVKDVSFQLKRGECLGLIGRNGAGKTTLLRMLNGIIRPDTGRIEMRGVVGAMIALGAGMKEVLTGRENAYSMAALRGMTRKEADRKIDEIIDFAEIDDAIDAPMQSYSSGMRVRLNFAVASSLNPDILLLDEVLAVGDAAFRNKCYRRIAEVRRNAAVIFVSHNMEQIARTSSHSLVMHRGQAAFSGSVAEGIEVYEALNQQDASSKPTNESFLSMHPPIVAFSATIQSSEAVSGAPLHIALTITSTQALDGFSIKVLFYNSRGAFAADGYVDSLESGADLSAGENKMKLWIDSLPLKNGVYAVAFNLIDRAGDIIVWAYKTHTIRIFGSYVGGIADCHLRISLT